MHLVIEFLPTEGEETTVDEVVEACIAVARKGLMEGKEVPPSLLFIGTDEDGEDGIGQVSLENFFGHEVGKQLLAVVLPQLLADHNATHSIFVTEAWVLSGKSVEDKEEMDNWMREHGSLENHPDRKECLQVVVESLYLPTKVISYEILREGDQITLSERNLGKGFESVSGRFCTFMSEARARQQPASEV